MTSIITKITPPLPESQLYSQISGH